MAPKSHVLPRGPYLTFHKNICILVPQILEVRALPRAALLALIPAGEARAQFSFSDFSNVSQIPCTPQLQGTHVKFLICLLEVLPACVELWGKQPPALWWRGDGGTHSSLTALSLKSLHFLISPKSSIPSTSPNTEAGKDVGPVQAEMCSHPWKHIPLARGITKDYCVALDLSENRKHLI